jgi:hypothetical protein
MPKPKKHKITHPNPGPSATTDLTHDEIWDDSALIRSWNDAVKEYEYYHSLAAQGLDAEVVLDAAEAALAKGEELPLYLDGADAVKAVTGESAAGKKGDGDLEVPATTTARTPPSEDGEIDEDAGLVSESNARPNATNGNRSPTASERDAALVRAGLLAAQTGNTLDTASETNQLPDSAALPQPNGPAPSAAAVAGPAAQTLENLKMAYYWAGYYSGLYDGQVAAQQPQPQQQQQQQDGEQP